MRGILFIGALLVSGGTLSAQSYMTAAGFRFGEGANLSVQQYITRGWTAEGIVHTGIFTKDKGLTVLGEKHQKLFFRNLNFYYGGGFHYYAQSEQNRVDSDVLAKGVAGVSGILGAELSVGRLNIGVDFKPEMHLAGDQTHPLEWMPAAVSVRYIIKKRERRKIRDWDGWDRFKKK